MASSRALNIIASFCLLSSFVLLGTSTRQLNQQQDLVSFACNNTIYVEVCMSSLRSDPLSETADLRGLASIALNLSIAHGKETKYHIHDLKSKSVSESRCLNECKEEYGDAVENLEDSVHALRIRFYDEVNTLVSAAMTDSDTCDDCFTEIDQVRENPLTERIEYFHKLCSNFLSITKLLF